MKTALALLAFVLVPFVALASDPSAGVATQQPGPVAEVREALKRLKPGMDRDVVMHVFPAKSLKESVIPVVTAVGTRYSYDLGNSHSLTLEFDPLRGPAQPMHLARAVLQRNGKIIAQVGK